MDKNEKLITALRCTIIHKLKEEKYRKNGIAKDLVDELLIWFRNKNISKVKLDASKAGVPLYNKIGFESSIEMSINLDDKS